MSRDVLAHARPAHNTTAIPPLPIQQLLKLPGHRNRLRAIDSRVFEWSIDGCGAAGARGVVAGAELTTLQSQLDISDHHTDVN